MRRQRTTEDYMQLIDFIFGNEDALRELVEEERLKRPPASEVKNASQLSDPTAAEAIDNLTPVRYVILNGRKIYAPETWLDVIGSVYKYLTLKNAEYSRAVRRFYRNDNYISICHDAGFGIDKLYRIISRARQNAAIKAAWHKLIMPL